MRHALVLALLPCAACAAPALEPAQCRAELERANQELEAGELERVEQRLNRVLALAASDSALERFRAAETLARLAAARSFALEAPGARAVEAAAGSAQRDRDETGGVVLVVYHAAQALDERERAARAEAAGGGTAGRSVAEACAGLRILLAAAHERLGFPLEAGALLAASELQQARSALARFEALDIPPGARTWACHALFERLRGRDELEAYRFAVLALEGRERFGLALPEAEAARLAAWIEGGARAAFVCPRSQTPWLRGMTRSPLSGVPHLDYVAVERTP
jgi:hypothetical protein